MFVLRREQTISPGRTSEYDAYQKQSLEAVRHQPGFLRDLRAMHLGNHDHRLQYQVWQSKEAFLAYSRSQHWVRPPEGLEPGISQSGYYESFASGEDLSPDQGHFVVDRAFRVINGHQDEFETAEARLNDMARGQEGLVARYTLKFLGNDEMYLRVSIWQSWEQLAAWMSTPAHSSQNLAVFDHVLWTAANRCEFLAAVAADTQRLKDS